jgi:hypothetical protein
LTREPRPEALDLLVDDRLRSHRFALALDPVVVGDVREIVDVVEVDVLEVVDRGIEGCAALRGR